MQLASGRHEVITGDGARDEFDEVVLACHADTALALIRQPTRDETAVLSAFSFRDNHAVLHGDTRLMPKARAAWASWIYTGCSTGGVNSVSVTYWMNQLQNLPGPPLFVTLNASQEIDERTVIDRHTFRHPVLSRGSVAAQARLLGIVRQARLMVLWRLGPIWLSRGWLVERVRGCAGIK